MESAVTACCSVAEACGIAFDQYYVEVMSFLIKYLVMEVTKEYKQFKGQLIEAITIISITVSKELLLKFSDDLV